MSSNALKLIIIKSIANTEDTHLLKEINALLRNKKDRVLELPNKVIEEIELARKQIKKGEFKTQEVVEKQFSKWKS